MAHQRTLFLTDAQLRAEIGKCEYCAEKPCREACPADCSPADFIMAAKVGGKSDYRRAAALIMGNNPLGGVCGAVCPEKHCQQACVHRTFDAAVNIPAVQATIIEKAKQLGVLPQFPAAQPNGRKIAIAGAGPAGAAAAATLAQLGYRVELHEAEKAAGGMCRLIPAYRLARNVLKTDLAFVKTLGAIRLKSGAKIADPRALLKKCDAVIVATGLGLPIKLNIPGEKFAIAGLDYLREPGRYKVKGKRVAVIGGGAIAADCAGLAAVAGAAHVELLVLEKLSEMPLPAREMKGLVEHGIHVANRTRVAAILKNGRKFSLKTIRVELPAGEKFQPAKVRDCPGVSQTLKGFDAVVLAIGNRLTHELKGKPPLFFTNAPGSLPGSVVEAVATGKNTALEVDAYLRGERTVAVERWTKSSAVLAGRQLLPVPLAADFFGSPMLSPFLLSAAPPSDGYEQMKKAYDAGWPGGVMKTAFDNVPIHIPAEYMFAYSKSTFANCDNVSGHSLDRVCREVERLVREYPERLTLASTGGPVTGHDETDLAVWQANTRKLESAGAMGIEYSLSCPQGGDGAKGDMVSQDSELTAKVVDWVMAVSQPNVPKLFKLTAAVTAIDPIIAAIKDVLAKYPGKKAGVTLANTFPTLAFRQGGAKRWEEGIIAGMSGEGVIPISNLTLARVGALGLAVSGNGGPMDYKAAANFLALGARTVQFCTIVMKYGYGIIADLHSGLSHLLAEREFRSMHELIGCALPGPIRAFPDLSARKKISAVDAELCQHCGNCTRCPYLAVSLDGEKVPETDPARCIGCSLCVQQCFSGALQMRERTPREMALLSEA